MFTACQSQADKVKDAQAKVQDAQNKVAQMTPPTNSQIQSQLQGQGTL